MNEELEAVKKQQCLWARGKGIDFDKRGYVKEHFDNLYNRHLMSQAQNEYQQADGAELDHKMWALHSSSALVYNFFDYWRRTEVAALAQSLRLLAGPYTVALEHKLNKPPGVPGKKPNVDVFFFGGHLISPAAVEAKFTEPYQRRTKMELKSAYVMAPCLWDNYPKCGILAAALTKNEGGFLYLDAPQLLKHIVGLRTAFDKGAFELIYLWYKVPGDIAARLESEINKFHEWVDDEVRFRALTYQELFAGLMDRRDSHVDWFEYMAERYFPMA